ncbi:MAG: J domain-containing protein [Candidatus Wallbacteria bacterium]|nr:J domain-containing protein [Candidatus Wallbacteria bacterium]
MGIIDRAKRILKSQINAKLDDLHYRGGPDDPLSEDGATMDDEAWFYAAKARQAGHDRQQSENHQRRDAGTTADLGRAYANLDCPSGSDLKTVRAAWKRLMKKYHPDKFANEPKKRESATKLTALLNESYQKLEAHLKARGDKG